MTDAAQPDAVAMHAQEQKIAKEYNFAEMRNKWALENEARLRAERELEELRRAMQQKSQPVEEDDESEPYVDHRRLQKKLSSFEQNLENKIDMMAEAKARALLEEEKRQMYLRENADFNSVMAPEVVQKFADKHPRIAENILRMPEGFERQKLVYETIKAMNLHQSQQDQKSDIQQRVDMNRRHPGYQPSGMGTAPYAGAGDFSAAGQKNAYEKLQELKRNLRI